MRELIPAFEHYLGTRHSLRTIRTYGAVLARFADFTSDTQTPTQHDVESFLVRHGRDGGARSPAFRNQELAALRAFAKFVMRDQSWMQNPTEGVPFAREAPRDPAVLSISELRRLFALAARAKTEVDRSRGLAILAVLSQAGLRVHELVALDVAQVDAMSATLVSVRGKGGPPRSIAASRVLDCVFGVTPSSGTMKVRH